MPVLTWGKGPEVDEWQREAQPYYPGLGGTDSVTASESPVILIKLLKEVAIP